MMSVPRCFATAGHKKKFVKRSLSKRNRKCFYVSDEADARRARVTVEESMPPRQKNTERNIGNQPHANRFGQQLPQVLGGLALSGTDSGFL